MTHQPCSKVKHKTKYEAIKALERRKELNKYFPRMMECRYYWCDECGCYHLTKRR